MLPDNFLWLVSKNSLRSGVPTYHATLWIDHENGIILDAIDEETKAFFTLPECLLGPTPFLAHRCLAQLRLDGRHQSRQVVLHHVVVGTGLHRGHGVVLANSPRNNDEGVIQAATLQQLERSQGAEVWHRIV